MAHCRALPNSPTCSCWAIRALLFKTDPLIASQMITALVETSKAKKLNAVRIMIDESDDQLKSLFERLNFRRGKLVDYTKKFKKAE